MSPVRADSMTPLSSNSARNLVRLVDVSREKEQPRPTGRDRLPESRRFLSAAFNAVGNRPAVHLSDGALAIHETADGSVVDHWGSSIPAIDHPVSFGFHEMT
jgi:hypothetical protein